MKKISAEIAAGSFMAATQSATCGIPRSNVIERLSMEPLSRDQLRIRKSRDFDVTFALQTPSAGCPRDASIDCLAELVARHISSLPDEQRSKAIARLFVVVTTAVFADNATSLACTPLPASLQAAAAPQLDKLRPAASAAPQKESGATPDALSWVLRPVEHLLLSPEGIPVRLSGREFILLEALAAAPGQLVSRRNLSRLFGYDELSPSTRGLDSLVYRLRQKARATALILPLNNIHGVGIRFTQPLGSI